MLNGKEVYRSLEVTEDIQTAKLGILDQIRLITANLSNNDIAELDAMEKLSVDRLRKISSLSIFIEKTTDKMKKLGEKSATVKLSSEYLPYLDEVIDKKSGFGRYYEFNVMKKDIPLSVKHTFIMKISKK